MCGGIQYQDHKIYFPQPDARLPVKLRHGGVTWIIWGRRKEEAIGNFPIKIDTVIKVLCIFMQNYGVRKYMPIFHS